MAPKKVAVTFSGPRNSFYFLGEEKMKLFLKMWNLSKGKRVITISSTDLSFPKNIYLENFEPRKITVVIAESPKSVDTKN